MLARIVVTAAGLALIVFVNWYFLLSRRKPRR
jgi:plastocyanin domain-containing protein